MFALDVLVPMTCFLLSVVRSSKMVEANLVLCNVFWRANLTCNSYIHGDPKLNFDELWPNELQLSRLLECLFNDGFRLQALAYSKYAVQCGSLKMLKVLLKKKYIGKYCRVMVLC